VERSMEISQEKVARELKSILAQGRKLQDLVENRGEPLAEKIRNAQNKGHYDAINELLTQIRRQIPEQVKKIEDRSKSEILVGVVGKYSHGKSSMLNGILGSLAGDRETLPTGVGVVTSLPSILRFRRDLDTPIFRTGPQEAELSSAEYKALAKGSSAGRSLAHVDYLQIEVPAQGVPFLESLADMRLVLVDTPGLGGPYWKDVSTLREWMSRFSMVIFALKATDINADTARVMDVFLKDFSRPVLPVITFWDEWHEASDYASCRTGTEAMARCRELVEMYFDTMKGEGRTEELTPISSSAFVKGESADAQDPRWSGVSPDWNMDVLQRAFLTHVSPRKDPLSGEMRPSPVETHRLQEISRGLREMLSLFLALTGRKDEVLKRRPGRGTTNKGVDAIFEAFEEKVSSMMEQALERVSERIEILFESYVDDDDLEGLNRRVGEAFRSYLRPLGGKIQDRIDSIVIERLEVLLVDEYHLDKDRVERILKPFYNLKKEVDLEGLAAQNLTKSHLSEAGKSVVSVLKNIFGGAESQERKRMEARRNQTKHWKKTLGKAALQGEVDRRLQDFRNSLRDAREGLGDALRTTSDKTMEIEDQFRDFMEHIGDLMEEMRERVVR